jgi:hypothetical protein
MASAITRDVADQREATVVNSRELTLAPSVFGCCMGLAPCINLNYACLCRLDHQQITKYQALGINTMDRGPYTNRESHPNTRATGQDARGCSGLDN